MYNPYYISKDTIHIIRTTLENSGSYGSICWARFTGHNTYTRPRRVKGYNDTPIQVPVLKNDIKFYDK